MKYQADKGRSERSFAVGAMVYLKLQPYVSPAAPVTSSASNSLGHSRSLQKLALWRISWHCHLGHRFIRCSMCPSSSSHPAPSRYRQRCPLIYRTCRCMSVFFSVAGLPVIILWSKASFSGLSLRRSWPPGNLSLRSIDSSLVHRPRDMPALKPRGLSATKAAAAGTSLGSPFSTRPKRQCHPSSRNAGPAWVA
jgi:hypothetical protein